jgi:hypothetical protein
VTTSDERPSGRSLACKEAAMNEQELKEHLENVHGVHVSDDSADNLELPDWAELHQIDHDEWLADQHMHDEPDSTCEGSVGEEHR